MPSTSIALCTYNASRFLEQQLDSYLTQSILPNELVVCDDASTDETITILKQFKEKSPFKVFIFENEKNLGYVKNFEKAVEHCTKDIIFLSDQDDVWLPNKIERISLAFDKNPNASMALTNAHIVDDTLNKLNNTLWQEFGNNLSMFEGIGRANLFDLLLRNRVANTGATMAFRRAIVAQIMPFPSHTVIHDKWIALCQAALGSILFVDEPLVLYRQHGEQQIGVGIKTTEKRSWKSKLTQKYGGKTSDLQHALQSSQTLYNHLIAKNIDPAVLASLSHQMAHYKMRLSLPKLLLPLRIIPIFKDVLNQRYFYYTTYQNSWSKIASAALSDLLF